MSVEERVIDIGDRVIVAAAGDRGSDVLGTVIERDPYADRDALVMVLHDDGMARWRRRDALRALGHRMPTDALAADLQLLAAASTDRPDQPEATG